MTGTIPTTLPTLVGTDKQIAWATTIREPVATELSRIAGIITACPGAVDHPYPALVLDLCNVALRQSKASWWIDNRMQYSIAADRAIDILSAIAKRRAEKGTLTAQQAIEVSRVVNVLPKWAAASAAV